MQESMQLVLMFGCNRSVSVSYSLQETREQLTLSDDRGEAI